MNNLKSISLVFALILGLSSCGANNEKSANDSSENKNQIEHASTDPLVDKDVIKLGVVGENNEDWDDVAHKKFLSQFNEESGSDIVDIADTSIAPLGIYSSKIDDLADLEDGARIAIPDDPTNGARSLFLLQSAGLIEVEGKDGDPITVDEITANPRNFEIVELSASQTARSLDDVDIACVNSGMAVDAGFVPTEDAIYLEDHNDPNKQIYVNVIATTKENENSKVLKDLIDNYYHQDATKKIINEVSKGSSIPVW